MRQRALALTLALLALDVAAAASVALPAVSAVRLATAASTAVMSVPELAVELQSLPNSCGPAAVATLARWLGVSTSEAEMLQAAALSPSGVSLAEFARLAALHGIEGVWFQVGHGAIGRLATPFALHLTRAGQGHFVLVKAVRGDLALIADPASGGAVVPLASLRQESTGRVFVLTRGAR